MEKTITIIIPIYNAQLYIEKALQSLLPLSIPSEVLLIDDGSTDNSASICQSCASQYDNVFYIKKEHTGVSDTRNIGIRRAKGKYILFLDADDELQAGSVEALVSFFDSCYDIVDLVTYPIVTHYYGAILAPHFRYRTMCYSGIFDLNQFPYIGQTTMNIMVKNQFENNILFDTSMTFSEDQKYCCDVLRKKMKIGFCKEARYIYNRMEESSSGKMKGACYIFEQSMKMFEDMFYGYNRVPLAFQGLYINDLAWKLRANMLYPYHYGEKQFQRVMDRIQNLLKSVDTEVILEHPEIDFFHKYYWLSLKPNHQAEAFSETDTFGIKVAGKEVFSSKTVEIVVTRIREDNGNLIIRGFLKSVVFSFSEKPKLFAVVNGEEIEQELYSSSHSYYLCHTKTNVFYAFCLEILFEQLNNFRFFMELEGNRYECTYYFMPKVPFSYPYERYDAVIRKRHIQYDKIENQFVVTNQKWDKVLKKNSYTHWMMYRVASLRRKAIALRKRKRIYLYYDCRGVKKDNGYYRFLEDYGKNDGIVRKYIVDPKLNLDELFSASQKKDVILFGSEAHKVYVLAAEKIYTAFIEDNNIFPFPAHELGLYSDFFDFEIEYLQHGILHADIPWKYTPEMIMADKICVSTEYEVQLFQQKYHFREQDIVRKCMPRLKQLDKQIIPENKILFAPSWRQYLIGANVDGRWQPKEEALLQSDYYQGMIKLLNSNKMHELLEQHNYTLEVKLHPIFKEYTHLFQIKNERIRIVEETDKIETYRIFMTDFSSFLFDFVYLGRKVCSFIPDEMQFRSGMNGYRAIEPESEALLEKILGEEDLEKIFEQPKEVNRELWTF